MKQLNSLSILFAFVLLLLAPNLAAAVFTQEAGEIPYQINKSDRIVIGTISEIEVHDSSANNTISVDERLYNPLPEKTIIVRTSSWAEDARFTKNESVLLMLNDQRPDKGVFYMSFGELGKHPVSDRDAIIKELKAQGKLKGEDQAGNETNRTEIAKGIETVDNHEGKSNLTQESNNTHLINPINRT